MSRAARYSRRLLVVSAVTAAIIGLGFVWRSSPAASIITDGGRPDRREVGGQPPPDGAERPERRDRHGGAAGLSSIDELGSTMLIGGAVMAAVVGIDIVRRRRNPVVPKSTEAATAQG